MRAHVYPLDAVRFCAALSVLAFHLTFYDWASRGSSVAIMFAHATSYPMLAPFTWFGFIGVEVFFVISGFVIANSANNATPMAFLKSRVLRLYPAVWVCAFITLAAWLLVDHTTIAHAGPELVRSLTLWIRGPWIDGVYWSLAVEMIFYALIFALLALGGFSRLPWAAWGMLAISGSYLALRLTLDAQLAAFPIWRFLTENENILLLRHGCLFAVGIWMWMASVRAMKPIAWLGLAAAMAGGCAEITLRARELLSGEVHVRLLIDPLIPIAIWTMAVGLMFAFALAPQRYAPRTPRTQAAFKRVGQMTYPLYLVHSVVGAAIIRTLVQVGIDRWLALGVAVSSALVLSYLVARIAEPDVRGVLRKVWELGEGGLQRTPVMAFMFKPGGSVANAGPL